MSQEKPKRRSIRFSLRTLLVLVTIAGVGFGWLGMKMRARHREREAVEAIGKIGGFVAYDYEHDLDNNSPTPPGSIWLRKLVGDDELFASVVDVHLICTTTDSGLLHVQELTGLKNACLESTQITDDGLRHLQALHQLEYLDLRNTKVTDAGLVHCKRLPQLKRLDLRETKVTDTGCRDLQKALPNLKIIR